MLLRLRRNHLPAAGQLEDGDQTARHGRPSLQLGIAGYTYGALLGAFLLGRIMPRAGGRDAIIAFLATLAAMTYVVRSFPLAFT